jgi:hypothetical protein
MGKRTELKVINYIIPESFGIYEPILVDDLTPEQRDVYAEKMAQNTQAWVQQYFSIHPERLP